MAFATASIAFVGVRSEELFDHVDRSVGANLSGANGKQSIQEGVLGSAVSKRGTVRK